MSELHVTSAANPRLKAVIALRRRRVREQEGSTVVDGYDELVLAVEAGAIPSTLLYCPELMHDPVSRMALVERIRVVGSAILRCGRAAFERVSYREGPDGFLGVVPVPGQRLDALVLPTRPLVLVAEGLEKPGNLGALLRTADAAGAAVAVAVDPVTDWGNPNVVRASKGTVFAVPVATASWEELRAWLRLNGIRLVATTPDAALRHTDADLQGPLAIAVGSEKHGLT
ncbi:MAG: RNA methyltransferase, partial [Dermatophilaceae bacterium]